MAPYEATAALLEDVASLNALHYDAARRQYLDYGEHTEDVALEWQTVEMPHGLHERHLRRVVRSDPAPQLVPHFGCGRDG